MTKFHESYGLDYSLTISSNFNSDLDISLLVSEINMFEDMFEGFMRIQVVLTDAIGLLDKYPVIGNEQLRF